MKLSFEHSWPVSTTRFFFPAVALQGFWKTRRILTIAFWTWRVRVDFSPKLEALS